MNTAHQITINTSKVSFSSGRPVRHFHVVCECGKEYHGTNSGMVAGFIADHDERLLTME